jgi:hypothetical protein
MAVHPAGHVIAALPRQTTTASSRFPAAIPLGSAQTWDAESAGVVAAAAAAMIGQAMV